MQLGKTARKRQSGAPQRNVANKALRAEWQQRDSKHRTNAQFPTQTCNGQKNRSVIVLNKKGKRVKN